MRHATALGLKLAAYLIIFSVTMPIFGLLALPQSMILAAVMTLLLWFADLLILPRFGTVIATVCDFMTMVIMTPLVLASMLAFPNPLGLTLSFALATSFEWWFHRWLASSSLMD